MRRFLSFLTLFLVIHIGNAQNDMKNFQDVISGFYNFFSEESFVNPSGNVILDMGAASAGRVTFNIKDVSISMEELPERPGCADICPPTTLINFRCNDFKKCIADPAFEKMGRSARGAITYDINRGKEAYHFLLQLQKYFVNK